MIKSAILSTCGRYRYQLVRQWDATLPMLPIVMLNPSTADADIDDPTIRRCVSFAKRDGYGGIMVGNLYAYRATKPQDLAGNGYPTGPDNPTHINEMFRYAAQWRVPILAAWGAHGHGSSVVDGLMLASDLWAVDLVCLGRTSAGAPRHPVRLHGDTPMTLWAGRG